MIGRIREALRAPSPPHGHPLTAAEDEPASSGFRRVLPPMATTERERIEVFAEMSEKLRVEFHECSNLADARQRLLALAKEENWSRLATHAGPLADAVVAELPASISLMRANGGYDSDALAAYEAGLTECDCLVAQTGSICVTSLSAGGRALSVLPPHHLVVARRAQLVGDLCEAYALLAQRYAAAWPSFVGFITGPSRTGDIERILVLGAHGPKRLTVLLVP
jgi:L-lactate dehydrogenase complex protein LldG